MILFSEKFADCHAFHIREEEPIPEEFTVHTHKQRIEIFCILSGKVVYHVEGNHYFPKPGDLLVTAPGEVHRVEVDPSVPYERMVIIFEPKMLVGLDPEGKLTRQVLEKRPGLQNVFSVKEAGRASWADRMGEIMRPAPEPRLQIIAALSMLLQQLLTVMADSGSKSSGTAQSNSIIRYINKNLSRELTLEHLCQEFYLSRAQLCRIFRSATENSVGNYITTKRMLLAQQLISQGNKPTQIFRQCGYRDYSSFFRAYSKFHGHPPKADLHPQTAPEQSDLIHIG